MSFSSHHSHLNRQNHQHNRDSGEDSNTDPIRDYLFGSTGAFYHSPYTLGSISRCHSLTGDELSSTSIQTQSPANGVRLRRGFDGIKGFGGGGHGGGGGSGGDSFNFYNNNNDNKTNYDNNTNNGNNRRNFSNDTNYSFNSIYLPPDVKDIESFLKDLPNTQNHKTNPFPRYKMILPKRMKILALDLDETLVHSTSKSSGDCDFFIEVFANECSCLYYVFKRPWVDKFLQTVSEWYHLVIYTASLQEYADPVIHWLEGSGGGGGGGNTKTTLFKKKLFRSSCIESGGNWIKDLQLIEEDLSRICLLDNSDFSFEINPDNGIPIESWTCDKKDTGLLDLLPFLDALRFTDDVRTILSLRQVGRHL